jgi:hypothetical protein
MSPSRFAPPFPVLRHLSLVLAACPLVGGIGLAQEGSAQEPSMTPVYPDPWRDARFELALSNDSFWAAFRSPLQRGLGHLELGVLANSDDDWLVNGRLMRYGEPGEVFPLSWGVGIGIYAAFIDDPEVEAQALALTASGRHRMPTIQPTTVIAEISFAPDITTFDDGEGLLDFSMRVETEVNEYASAFIGYRLLEVDLEHGSDQEVDDSLQVGLRLAF